VLWKDRWAALLARSPTTHQRGPVQRRALGFHQCISLFPWVFWATDRVAHGAGGGAAIGIALALLVVSGYRALCCSGPLWFWRVGCVLLATECAIRAARRQFLRGLALPWGQACCLSAGLLAAHRRPSEVLRAARPTRRRGVGNSLVFPDLLICFRNSTLLIPTARPLTCRCAGSTSGFLAFALAFWLCLHRPIGVRRPGVGWWLRCS